MIGQMVQITTGFGLKPEGSWPVKAPEDEVARDLHSMPMFTARGADSSCIV
jgi:hypothetical protein